MGRPWPGPSRCRTGIRARRPRSARRVGSGRPSMLARRDSRPAPAPGASRSARDRHRYRAGRSGAGRWIGRSSGSMVAAAVSRWPRVVPFGPMTIDPGPAHDPAGRARLVAALEPLGIDYELFACDPALADTAAFCAAYGFSPADSANTILVVGKSDPPRHAACVVLAPN